MSENKTGRYIKYAIGEIVLVVVGILIALSINNWNEGRKNQRKVQAHLASIRADLMQDLEEIESMSVWKKRIKCFHEAIPNFKLSDELVNLRLDTADCEITYQVMFNFQKSYRSNTGSFDAMIADGNANLISNKALFGKFQHLYNFWNPALLDVYNNERAISSNLKYKWAHLVALQPNTNISEIMDSTLVADLILFYKQKQSYITFLNGVEKLINEAIDEIDAELDK